MLGKQGLLGIIVAVCCILVAAGPATGEPYPNRPVKFLVPVPAGGSTDVAARVIAEFLSRSIGRPVYVENRSGANGTIGIEAAAKSPADGYTVLVGSDTVVSNPHLYKMNVDPLRDLIPVVELSRQPIVLAVNPSLGVGSLAELIELAKRRPGLSYATGSGLGSPQHMVMQWFAHLAGISLEQVPYRGGGPAINDLIAGHVKLGSLGSTPLIPHYKAGTLRLLAQSMESRSPGLPDVPTFQEAGVKGLVLEQWLGAFVPAGTPETVSARLNAEIGKALADPAVRESFLQSGQEPLGGTAEQFSDLVREEFAKYARLVRELNIRIN